MQTIINNKFPLTISIVIGSNESLIVPCIKSIFEGTDIPFDMYITSNLASAEIIEKIRAQFPTVKIITNTSRKGFAENHNRIIKLSFSSDYILILNDDTLIPKGSIESLFDFMVEAGHEKVAAVSPKLLNPDGTLQPSTYRFANILTIFLGLTGLRSLIPDSKFVWNTVYLIEKLLRIKGKTRLWDHSYTTDVDTFRGACVLYRKRAIEDVGLMDEVTLFGGEETEWHYRFKKKGWGVVFYSGSKIIHYGRESIKRQKMFSITLEEIKGHLNFYRKHRNPLSYLLLRCIIGFIFSFKYLLFLLKKEDEKKEEIKLYLEILKLVFSPDKYFKSKRVYYV